ncbi:hypothetical protein [Roseivivax sp. CAU 1761]
MADTLNSRPHTVERNLDFLTLPAGVSWFEWSEAARRTDIELLMHDVEHPERVGVLVAYANDDVGDVVGTVAWRFRDGRVDHAPAFFSWSETALADLSAKARHRYSQVPAESWARMMSLIYTHVPGGYVEEMEVLSDLREKGPDISTMAGSARREASAEALFMFATLLMLQTERYSVETGEGAETLKMIPSPPRSWWSISRKDGFSRASRKRGDRLVWSEVPAPS